MNLQVNAISFKKLCPAGNLDTPRSTPSAAQISSMCPPNYPCRVTGFKWPINKDLTHHRLPPRQGVNTEPWGETLGVPHGPLTSLHTW